MDELERQNEEELFEQHYLELEEFTEGIKEYYQEMRYQKKMIEAYKERIAFYFETIKEANDWEQAELRVAGVVLKEKNKKIKEWDEDFYDELIEKEEIHRVLKHGNNLNKRFDLSPYVKDKNPENRSLHFSSGRMPNSLQKQIIEETDAFEDMTFEEISDLYIRYKKLVDLNTFRYEKDKEYLLAKMKEYDIGKVNGFSIKDEATDYDFEKMYNTVMQERFELATNGTESVDLLSNTLVDITEEDLHQVAEIPKKFQLKRLKQLQSMLGDNFWFIEGYRDEENILKRFSISSTKVQELVDEDKLHEDVFEYKRSEVGETPSFEVVSEINEEKRKSTPVSADKYEPSKEVFDFLESTF